MRTQTSSVLVQLLKWLAVALIFKIVISVFVSYRDYFPPNFGSNFLRGRDEYFWQGYHWSFFVHILSGPWSLVLGTLLISDRFRLRFPGWHRVLGRIQVLLVLLLVLPSGFWMAFYAEAGPIAGASFVTLSFLTGLCIVLGWRTAVKRRFAVHRIWMQRAFLLLCSAVVIRITGGLGTMLETEFEWFNQISSWSCWVVPLLIYEISRRTGKKHPTPESGRLFVAVKN